MLSMELRLKLDCAVRHLEANAFYAAHYMLRQSLSVANRDKNDAAKIVILRSISKLNPKVR